jgi:uncharacterized protein (TIGR02996 family)
MSDDDAFLAGIAAAPADPLPRLVYADWLDDRGDPRAELVRLEIALATDPADDTALTRFRDLAAGCDSVWLARVVRPAVARCGIRFSFACPKCWDDMAPTGDPAVRHCDGCRKPVHLALTRAAARRLAEQDRCVAVDARLVRPTEARSQHDLFSRARRTAGIILADSP